MMAGNAAAASAKLVVPKNCRRVMVEPLSAFDVFDSDV
jgi:hypothetical protein